MLGEASPLPSKNWPVSEDGCMHFGLFRAGVCSLGPWAQEEREVGKRESSRRRCVL